MAGAAAYAGLMQTRKSVAFRNESPKRSFGLGPRAEVGMRTVPIPHLQRTVSVASCRIGARVFGGRWHHRAQLTARQAPGMEEANYHDPMTRLVFGGDIFWSVCFAE